MRLSSQHTSVCAALEVASISTLVALAHVRSKLELEGEEEVLGSMAHQQGNHY